VIDCDTYKPSGTVNANTGLGLIVTITEVGTAPTYAASIPSINNPHPSVQTISFVVVVTV
jgi:hypothetical protein